MPPTSHDAYRHAKLRGGHTSDSVTNAARGPSGLSNYPPALTGQPLVVGNTAYDTVRDREVQLVVGPGVYDAAKWWVRPVSGGDGWLATPDVLEPRNVDDHAE